MCCNEETGKNIYCDDEGNLTGKGDIFETNDKGEDVDNGNDI